MSGELLIIVVVFLGIIAAGVYTATCETEQKDENNNKHNHKRAGGYGSEYDKKLQREEFFQQEMEEWLWFEEELIAERELNGEDW